MTSNKNIFQITYPILLTLVAQNIVNVTDTAFLGRLGEVELGASAIGGVFYFAVFMIGVGFSQGTQIMIARRNGEKKLKEIGGIFNNALVFNILLSVLVFALSTLFLPLIMKLAVSSQYVFEATLAYVNIRIYAFFFGFANAIFRSFYVGVTQTRVLTISALLTAVSNFIFNYLLIFGNFGFPELGIEGSAIASVIAEMVAFVYIVFYTFFKIDIKAYGLFQQIKISYVLVKQILNLSVFIMLQYFISISTWFLFFIFIEHMGERSLAISNIARSLYILVMIPASALATTANTLVSNLIGAGLQKEVIRLTNKLAYIGLLLVFPLVLIIMIYPSVFCRIYTDNPSLIQASIPTIRIVALANIVFAFSFIVFSGVSGTGNTRTAFLIEFITLFFYLAYVYAATIVFPSTVAVVWLSEFVYWILIGGIGYYYLLYGNWQKKVI